jgi:hypothetical protein
MPKMTTPESVISFVRASNWLSLWSSDGDILNVYLTPAGKIIEIYFEKGKITVKELLSYVAK